jgi:hypothetical protein
VDYETLSSAKARATSGIEQTNGDAPGSSFATSNLNYPSSKPEDAATSLLKIVSRDPHSATVTSGADPDQLAIIRSPSATQPPDQGLIDHV